MNQSQEKLDEIIGEIKQLQTKASLNKFPDLSVVLLYAVEAFKAGEIRPDEKVSGFVDPWKNLVTYCEHGHHMLISGNYIGTERH